MIAAICLLVPPIIMTYIYCDKLFVKERKKIEYVVAYIGATAAINVTAWCILATIFKNSNEITSKLNKYNEFAIKYLVLSMALAVLFPYVIKLLKENVHISLKIGKISYSFKYWNVITIIYTLVLFGLNLIRIFDNNFWGDEAYTIRLSKMSFQDMLTATAGDVHPPLYYIVVQILCKIFGYSGVVYHITSLLPYMLILIFALTVVWKKWGKEATLIFVTFASVLPTAVTYNVEVRMYEWGALFVLLSFYFMDEVLKENKIRYYVGFVLMSLGAAYTHYYCLLSVALLYLVLISVALIKRKKYLIKVIIASVSTVVLYLPWFWILLQTFGRTSDSFWLNVYPTFKECKEYLFSSEYSNILFSLMLICIVVFVLYESKILRIYINDKSKLNISFKVEDGKINHNIIWIFSGLIAIFGTIIIGLIASEFIRPLLILRYLYPVSIIAWFVFSIAVSRLKGKTLYMILIVGITLCGSVTEYKEKYTEEKSQNEILEETLEATQDVINKDDVILTNNVHIGWTIADYYYPNVENRCININNIPELDKNVTYWLFVYTPLTKEVQTNIENAGFISEQVVSAGNLGTNTVYIYKVEEREEE